MTTRDFGRFDGNYYRICQIFLGFYLQNCLKNPFESPKNTPLYSVWRIYLRNLTLYGNKNLLLCILYCGKREPHSCVGDFEPLQCSCPPFAEDFPVRHSSHDASHLALSLFPMTTRLMKFYPFQHFHQPWRSAE